MNAEDLVKIPRVLGAGIATEDGFIVESQFKIGHNAERSAAMAAQIVHSIKRSLHVEKASAILYTPKSVFFIKESENGIFFVICQKDANLGLVKLKIDKIH